MSDYISLTLMTRAQVADFLLSRGYPTKRRYLQQLSIPSCGEGPPVHQYFGRRPLYHAGEVLEWAKSRGKPGSNKVA